MFSEDKLLPVSALQHLIFCERRAALVFIERLWDENLFTVEGRHLHERTHETKTEVRGDLRIARGLRIKSLRLGLSGMADVVEFHRLPDGPEEDSMTDEPSGVRLESVDGLWRPFPVEYKRGRLRNEKGYEIQLCAQALCLEEMLHTTIKAGALYYGKTGRRLDVAFDRKLRAQMERAAAHLHELIEGEETPRARFDKKCEKCSLLHLCMPKATSSQRNVSRYLDDMIIKAEGGGEGERL